MDASAIHAATTSDDSVVTVGGGGITTKFDASGALVWTRNLGPMAVGVGTGIAIGPDGGVYTIGSCTGTITLPGSSVPCGQGAFVAAYDADGTPLWARSYPLGLRITITSDQRLVVTGCIGNGTLDFGGFTLTSGNSSEEVVASLGADGTVQWARTLGLPSHARNVAADTHGNVVAAAMANPGTVSMFDRTGKETWRASSTTDGAGLMGVAVVPSGRVVTSSRFAFEVFDANGRLADVHPYDFQPPVGGVVEVVSSSDGSLAFTGNYDRDGTLGSVVGLLAAPK